MAATGNSYNSLHFEYLQGAVTVREIVKDICEQICICVQPEFMPDVSEDSWLNIATQFYDRTDFPNCIGAVDGKHIRLKKPDKTGTEFYNYTRHVQKEMRHSHYQNMFCGLIPEEP
ncbi:unnamed protein product [Acanthoscelides obtectus]|uniref:DDE Tnp4 domain-containing protein n=1 Tax=Acanthoscelides obtectus TaxID=200917 RepID=A0A9P0K7X4_ACAOB|nr:unnamed protein product [Acanthoscelides obtectus]CAK1655485.1 hypothetical protein AOBTE_LOCUS19190 [Acanthoscelides obtectus]